MATAPLAAAAAVDGYVSDVSPVIDTQRTSAVLINHVIDDQVDSAGAPITLINNKPMLFQPSKV